MKLLKTAFTLVIVISQFTSVFAQTWTTVPSTSINLYDLLEVENDKKEENFPAFEISSQILFKDYKVFLNELKKDSSLEHYAKHLPDSTICLKLVDYQEYLTNPKFDNSPVAGISWEAAINYCNWKTLKDNSNTDPEFYYRLPLLSEWLIANRFLNDTLTNDFSDWTMNAFDESTIDFSKNLNFDYLYAYQENDPPVLKRKHYRGRNFLYNHTYFYGHYGYANKGYRNISFRLIKVNNTNQEKTKESLLKY